MIKRGDTVVIKDSEASKNFTAGTAKVIQVRTSMIRGNEKIVTVRFDDKSEYDFFMSELKVVK